MKSIIPLVLLAAVNHCFSQESDVPLAEGEVTGLCGKYIVFESIWIEHGVRKADISVLESKNSKPITGGYTIGDTLELSGKKGCKFLIREIEKYGIMTPSTRGYLVLAHKPWEPILSLMQGRFEIKEGEEIFYGDTVYKLARVYKSRKPNPVPIVEVKISRENLDTTVQFTQGDVICWSEGFPFALISINVERKTIVFEKMEDYIVPKIDGIRGEDINKPPGK